MTPQTPGDDAFPAAAGDVFAQMVQDRLAVEGLSAEVSTEQYANGSEQDRAVWAVWISIAEDPNFLICEVAEGDEFVSVLDDAGADTYTQPGALAYIASRVGGRTSKQARAAARAAAPRLSNRPRGGARRGTK